MGTLDWSELKTDQLRLSAAAGKGEIHDLRVELNLPTLKTLIGALRPIYTEGMSARGGELSASAELPALHPQGRPAGLRLMLPAGWSLFFKQQLSGPSRLMVAHPEPELWVGTLLLSPTHGLQTLNQLSALQSQKEVLTGAAPEVAMGASLGASGGAFSFRDQLPMERTQSLFSNALNNLNLTVSLLGS